MRFCGVRQGYCRVVNDGQALGDATIEQRCGACGAVAGVVVTQTLVEDRIAWAVSTRCGQCGDAQEQCGWDEMPSSWRDALVAQEGLTRIRTDRESSQPAKARLLSVFRKRGATIAEAIEAYESLTDGGIVGTPAEMKLLARRLTSVGAIVSLTPELSHQPDRG